MQQRTKNGPAEILMIGIVAMRAKQKQPKTAIVIGVLLILVAIIGGVAGIWFDWFSPTAWEIKRFQGVWAHDPPQKEGRLNVLRFQGKTLVWRSTRYID